MRDGSHAFLVGKSLLTVVSETMRFCKNYVGRKQFLKDTLSLYFNNHETVYRRPELLNFIGYVDLIDQKLQRQVTKQLKLKITKMFRYIR